MQRARGFSLIELVIVTIVLSIMAVALSPLIYTSLRAYDTTLGNIVVLDKLRYATERLAREIREVNYDLTVPNGTGFAITSSMGTGTANSIRFTRTFYDSSGNSSTATVSVCNTGTTVTLAYSADCNNTQVLTDALGSTGNLVFSFLGQDGRVLTSPTRTTVRAVQITLTLLHNGNPYQQITQVELKRFSSL